MWLISERYIPLLSINEDEYLAAKVLDEVGRSRWQHIGRTQEFDKCCKIILGGSSCRLAERLRVDLTFADICPRDYLP